MPETIEFQAFLSGRKHGVMLVWLVKTGSVSTHWQSFWRGVILEIHEVYCLRVLLARSIT